VLVIGEIRDEETANIVVRAALTGHMVIATLHAGSCQGVVERLLILCSDQYSVVSALELVLNQRLVRRLCPACDGKGCSACLGTGYRGRVPLVEWLKLDAVLRGRIRTQGPGVIVPTHSLTEAVRELLRQKLSDKREIERVFGPLAHDFETNS
jgi:type II secretory ATPase GspE/PulE/Tfp pilus assembly ATPase PilB-like protein